MRAADLRGAARLAADATVAMTEVVEAMHERIARVPGRRPSSSGRTQGITGFVYRSIRATARVVGGSFDRAMGLLPHGVEAGARNPTREAVLSALNGVLGDHLARTGNPLAIPMTLRVADSATSSDELLVLIHGLCMNDLQWRHEGHDHGEALARSLGMTPVYVHYNTGLSISANGRELANQLGALVDAWPRKVRRGVLLGHSMGGLVARSALHHGAKASDLVCLGTPHEGAPLERIGHWVEGVIEALPYASPLARVGRLRSAGITDLRHGWISDDHRPVPLPEDVRCFAIAGSLGSVRKDLKGRLLGDGLVPVASALGRHRDRARTLRFPESRQAIAWKTGHLQLLSSPEVQSILERWL